MKIKLFLIFSFLFLVQFVYGMRSGGQRRAGSGGSQFYHTGGIGPGSLLAPSRSYRSDPFSTEGRFRLGFGRISPNFGQFRRLPSDFARPIGIGRAQFTKPISGISPSQVSTITPIPSSVSPQAIIPPTKSLSGSGIAPQALKQIASGIVPAQPHVAGQKLPAVQQSSKPGQPLVIGPQARSMPGQQVPGGAKQGLRPTDAQLQKSGLNPLESRRQNVDPVRLNQQKSFFERPAQLPIDRFGKFGGYPWSWWWTNYPVVFFQYFPTAFYQDYGYYPPITDDYYDLYQEYPMTIDYNTEYGPGYYTKTYDPTPGIGAAPIADSSVPSELLGEGLSFDQSVQF